jgi:hypothetical protein
MRLSGRKPSSFTRPWRPRQRVVLLALISVNVGEPIVLREPKSAMARSFKKFVASLMGGASAAPAPARRPMLSIFSRGKSSPSAPGLTSAQSRS